MMYYETMPLYPSLRPCDGRESCVRVPVFDGDRCGPPRPMTECRRVTIENPCRPGECAEVILGVDECGSLVVCVRRDPRGDRCGPPGCRPRREPCFPPEPCRLPEPCRPRREPCRPPEPRRGCERGRLYGTWR